MWDRFKLRFPNQKIIITFFSILLQGFLGVWRFLHLTFHRVQKFGRQNVELREKPELQRQSSDSLKFSINLEKQGKNLLFHSFILDTFIAKANKQGHTAEGYYPKLSQNCLLKLKIF